MSSKIRVWAAVKAPDGTIQCSVDDYDSVPNGDAWLDQPDFRVMKMVAWSPDMLSALIDEQRACTRVNVCAPGRPCEACTAAAAENWWVEWEKRNAKRYWIPGARGPQGLDPRACHHRHKKKATALACATKLGFAKVYDGCAEIGAPQAALPVVWGRGVRQHCPNPIPRGASLRACLLRPSNDIRRVRLCEHPRRRPKLP